MSLISTAVAAAVPKKTRGKVKAGRPRLMPKAVVKAQTAFKQAEARLSQAREQYETVHARRQKLEDETEKALRSGNGKPSFGIESARAVDREAVRVMADMERFVEESSKSLAVARSGAVSEADAARLDRELEKSVRAVLKASNGLTADIKRLNDAHAEAVKVLGRSIQLDDLHNHMAPLKKILDGVEIIRGSRVLGAWRGDAK